MKIIQSDPGRLGSRVLKKVTMKETKKTIKIVKPFTTVYIGNLDYGRDERDIKELFSRYGKVKSVKIVLDTETEKSKGIAFVQMPEDIEAKSAIKGLNGLRFDNRTLKVSEANDRFAEVDAERIAKRAGPPKLAAEKEDKTLRPRKRDAGKKQGLGVLFKYLASQKK